MGVLILLEVDSEIQPLRMIVKNCFQCGARIDRSRLVVTPGKAKVCCFQSRAAVLVCNRHKIGLPVLFRPENYGSRITSTQL